MIFTITKSCMDNFICWLYFCVSEQMPRDKVICWLILAYHLFIVMLVFRCNNNSNKGAYSSVLQRLCVFWDPWTETSYQESLNFLAVLYHKHFISSENCFRSRLKVLEHLKTFKYVGNVETANKSLEERSHKSFTTTSF